MTDQKKLQQRSLAVLAAFFLAGLAVLVFILVAPVGAGAKSAAGPGFQLPEPAQSETLGFILTEAEQRPLFNPYRLPAISETQSAELEANTGDVELSLHGIIRRGGEARAAIAPAGGTGPAWYSTGDAVAGWVLEAIMVDRISLRRGDKEQTLLLHPPK